MAFLNWKPFLHYESFVYRTMLRRSAVICTAVALKRHERVNAFNLLVIYWNNSYNVTIVSVALSSSCSWIVLVSNLVM